MIESIAELVTRQKYPDALLLLDTYLKDNPDDEKGLFLFGQIMLATQKTGLSYATYKYLLTRRKDKAEIWINFGKSNDELHMYEEAKKCYQKALKLDPGNKIAILNMSSNGVHMCRPEQAIHWANKILKDDPENISAHVNLGFAYLMQQDFKRGWDHFEYGMGNIKWRDERNYTGEPKWDGSKGKVVVIYGEQGLGDQIAMTQCMTEARRDCKTIIFDTHKKLKNLFARSFLLETHGDMFEKEISWPFNRSLPIEASCSLSTLQRYYRNDIKKYTGKPHLVPCPIRSQQWRQTFKGWGDKPKIGIAWTGGISETQKINRSTTLEVLKPILQNDAIWVSLEYKDRSEEIKRFKKDTGIEVLDFPWVTMTSDYDDTAALVNELDLVIGVPTTAIHLAGALGVSCWSIVHPKPHFMFGLTGETMPFYKSVKLYRRKANNWGEVVNKVAEDLREWIAKLSYPLDQDTSRSTRGPLNLYALHQCQKDGLM